MQKNTKTLSTVALVITSCVLALTLAEISAYWWVSNQKSQAKENCPNFSLGAFANSRGISQDKSYYEPDSVINHCSNEFNYNYHIDKNGLRNHQNYQNNPKVLAIGDSFTFGFGVEDEEAFPALIGAYNAGMWGNPFDIQYKSFLRNVELFNPNVVIWGLYAPHIITMMDGSWNKNCPGDMNLNIDSAIVMQILNWLPFQKIFESSLGELIFKSLNIWKVGLEKDNLILRRNCYETKEVLLFDKNIGSTLYTNDKKVNKTYKTELSKVLNKMEFYFRDAKLVADQKGIKIIFLFIPSRLYLQINDGDNNLQDRYENGLISAEYPRHIVENTIINAGFDSSSILDLSIPFLAEPDWRNKYFKVDAHWNKEGHEFVAKEILTFLNNLSEMK